MLLSDKKAISVSEDEDEGILVGGSQVTVLELKTSHGHDGRSLSTLSPLGWGRWVLMKLTPRFAFLSALRLDVMG